MIITAEVSELTRKIKLPTDRVLSVNGDYQVDGIAFKLPATYEGDFDFSTAAARVHWTGVDKVEHTNLITEEDGNGYPLWVMPSELTQGGHGVIEFAISFVATDETAAVTKRWISDPISFRNRRTVNGSNEDEEAEEETTYDRLASAIADVRAAQASVDEVNEVLAGITNSSPVVVATVADLSGLDVTKHQLAIVRADGYLYYYGGSAWQKGIKYGSYELDTTLTESGKAADAAAVGAEVSAIKEDLSAVDERVTAIEDGDSGSGLTDSQKRAILNCFQHVAWTDDQGQTYYDELEDVLFPPAELRRITAVYSNAGDVYPDASLDDLKPYITVTAHYSDGTTETVNAYTLSGTLEVGTSTITVSYSGKRTTINVVVVEKPKSDMTQWSDGVAYTDIEVISDSYYNASGNITPYTGWERTGKIPIHGAVSVTFEGHATGNSAVAGSYCWWFKEDGTPLSNFGNGLSAYEPTTKEVPSEAYYFGISGTNAQINGVIRNGITPYGA